MIEGERRGGTIQLGELRIKLDQMTERITSRLKDRSRFPVNRVIYQPDGIPIAGRAGISLFQFALEGLELYHASLGRYSYSDQHPVLDLSLPSPRVGRLVSQSQLPNFDINIGNNLLSFYPDLMLKYCKPLDDPDSYGETAYVDADLIQMINERVNIGRNVADAKGRSNPAIYQIQSSEELYAKLKDQSRENVLIEKARGIAISYGVDPNLIEEAFRWIMNQTLNVEVQYVHKYKTFGKKQI